MGYREPIAARCEKCHAKDPNKASWDPYDQELIRYCEICHSVATLHRISPHVEDSPGWEAVGFYVSANTNHMDADPLVYRTWSALGPYLPEAGPGFSPDELCLGCHWVIMPEPPEVPPSAPVIDITTAGIQPNHGCCGDVAILRGEFFGDEPGAGYGVEMQRNGRVAWWEMPVYCWTDTLIEFEVPCRTLAPANYRVRGMTPQGTSNHVVFTLETISRSRSTTPASATALLDPEDLKLGGSGCFVGTAAYGS